MGALTSFSSKDIELLFDSVASRYDLTNRILSLSLDKKWRKGLVQRLPREGNVLDLCTGTADLSFSALSLNPQLCLTGIDISQEMLRGAIAKKIKRKPEGRLQLVRSDWLCLPFKDGYFDAAMVAFGLRNVSDRKRALKEAARVLKPGGIFLLLEFVPSQNEFSKWYLNTVVPFLGGLVSGKPASYRYLSASIESFLSIRQISGLLLSAGMEAVHTENYFLRTVYLFSARKSRIEN